MYFYVFSESLTISDKNKTIPITNTSFTTAAFYVETSAKYETYMSNEFTTTNESTTATYYYYYYYQDNLFSNIFFKGCPVKDTQCMNEVDFFTQTNTFLAKIIHPLVIGIGITSNAMT